MSYDDANFLDSKDILIEDEREDIDSIDFEEEYNRCKSSSPSKMFNHLSGKYVTNNLNTSNNKLLDGI